MTLRRIQRLPTSVGLAQARPNKLKSQALENTLYDVQHRQHVFISLLE